MIALPDYLTEAGIEAGPLAEGRFLAAVIGFGAPRPACLPEGCPFGTVDMPVLDRGPAYEVWSAPGPGTWHDAAGVRYAIAGDRMLGILESDRAQAGDIEAMASTAYGRLFGLADGQGFPHVLRVFNFLPRLLETEQGSERYRRFNAGRHAAFSLHGRLASAPPAASALGTRGGAPALYFLASRRPGQAMENPRQVSAYRYPQRYGPVSPDFSRAMHADGPDGRQLFISGTASIVGHESRHLGDPLAQTDEILRNLDAILLACGTSGLAAVAPSLRLRAYLRRPQDVPGVLARLDGLPACAGVMVVQADVCREELLVEIEACCALGKEG